MMLLLRCLAQGVQEGTRSMEVPCNQVMSSCVHHLEHAEQSYGDAEQQVLHAQVPAMLACPAMLVTNSGVRATMLAVHQGCMTEQTWRDYGAGERRQCPGSVFQSRHSHLTMKEYDYVQQAVINNTSAWLQ